MRAIVTFDRNMDLTEEQLDISLANIKEEYLKIGLMPERTRRTKKVIDRLVKLKMLEGLLLGFKREF